MKEVDDLNRKPTKDDRDYFSYKRDLDGKIAKRTSAYQTYSHKLALLEELKCRGVDVTLLPLLVNDQGISITLNDGSLIYTE